MIYNYCYWEIIKDYLYFEIKTKVSQKVGFVGDKNFSEKGSNRVLISLISKISNSSDIKLKNNSEE